MSDKKKISVDGTLTQAIRDGRLCVTIKTKYNLSPTVSKWKKENKVLAFVKNKFDVYFPKNIKAADKRIRELERDMNELKSCMARWFGLSHDAPPDRYAEAQRILRKTCLDIWTDLEKES